MSCSTLVKFTHAMYHQYSMLWANIIPNFINCNIMSLSILLIWQYYYYQLHWSSYDNTTFFFSLTITNSKSYNIMLSLIMLDLIKLFCSSTLVSKFEWKMIHKLPPTFHHFSYKIHVIWQFQLGILNYCKPIIHNCHILINTWLWH